jgi:4-amino-4-deoxy-L-arabinose transferase-like glycosyltransferase
MSTRSTLSFYLQKRPWAVFLLFTLLVVVLRWSGFYHSVLDLDESIYILIADAWLDGHTPYTTIFDNKPPGIYAIYAALLFISKGSILSIRIAACIFISLTCFILYKLAGLFDRENNRTGLIAGIVYALSSISMQGNASNTELFFSPFVVFAFYLFLSSGLINDKNITRINYFKLIFAGLLLGLAFEIKFVVVFDFLAMTLILIVLVIFILKPEKKIIKLLQSGVALSIGFLMPFLIVSAAFYSVNQFDDYFYANITANRLRTVANGFNPASIIRAIQYLIFRNHLLWISIPGILLYLYLSRTVSQHVKLFIFIVCTWFLIIVIGIISIFRNTFYAHYFLQLAPVLSLATAFLLVQLIFAGKHRLPGAINITIIGIILIYLIITSPDIRLNLEMNVRHVYHKHILHEKYWADVPAQIANYIKPELKTDDYIYIPDNEIIVYYLTQAKLPTRYVFPPLLMVHDDMPAIARVDPLSELQRILHKQPVFIIKFNNQGNALYNPEKNHDFLNMLNRELSLHYSLDTTISVLDIYKIKKGLH